MCRRRAAATTHDVQPTVFGPFLNCLRHRARFEIELTHFVRRAGVGMAADVGVGDLGKFFDVRTHDVRTQRTIHPDTDHREVRDAVPKRFDDLS